MGAPKEALEHLTASEKLALGEFLPALRQALGKDLLEVRLFGSRARGDRHEDSDLDVAIVVTEAGRTRRNEIYDLAFDIQLQSGVNLAPLVIEISRLDELRERELLIAHDLDQEGIAL